MESKYPSAKNFVFIPVYGIRFKRKFSLAIKKPVRNIT